MQSGLVSIIVPCYNAVRTIEATLQSLQAQSYSHWQAWVIDDASTDNTAALIKAASAGDPRIRLLQQPHNQQVVAARNRGIAAAQGQYLAFCDADDLWTPQKLATQIEFMQQKNAAFCYTDFRRINANGQKMGVLQQPPQTVTYDDLLGGNPICVSSVVLDLSKCRQVQFNSPYPTVADFCLWLDLTQQGFVGQRCPIDGVRYRVAAQSMSANKLQAAQAYWAVLTKRQKLPMLQAVLEFFSYAKKAVAKRTEF
jgi:teichuronic acid biosynthesis glycosyltransferase TuaG